MLLKMIKEMWELNVIKASVYWYGNTRLESLAESYYRLKGGDKPEYQYIKEELDYFSIN